MIATRNVCYGNAGCLATKLRPVRPLIVELRTSQIGVHAHHKAPVTWPYYFTWYTHWQSQRRSKTAKIKCYKW